MVWDGVYLLEAAEPVDEGVVGGRRTSFKVALSLSWGSGSNLAQKRHGIFHERRELWVHELKCCSTSKLRLVLCLELIGP